MDTCTYRALHLGLSSFSSFTCVSGNQFTDGGLQYTMPARQLHQQGGPGSRPRPESQIIRVIPDSHSHNPRTVFPVSHSRLVPVFKLIKLPSKSRYLSAAHDTTLQHPVASVPRAQRHSVPPSVPRLAAISSLCHSLRALLSPWPLLYLNFQR